MLTKMFDAMFGCHHSHYSFPITVRAGLRQGSTSSRAATYVVCLDCAKELPYDWSEMRIVDSQPQRVARSLVTKEAA